MIICQKCKGKGYYEDILKDLAGREPHSCGIHHAAIPCNLCDNGKVSPIESEAYYERVSQWGKRI
jgi:hypothetical protein